MSGSITDKQFDALNHELRIVIARYAAELASNREAFLAEHQLLNAAGAAELLAVGESWIREKTSTGEIPSIPLGGYRRYHPPTLLKWFLGLQEGGDV